MSKTLGVTEARDQLMKLADEMTDASAEAVTITKHGKPVLAVLPYTLYESLLETLSILGDPDTAEALQRSLADISAGRVQDVEDVLAELGW